MHIFPDGAEKACEKVARAAADAAGGQSPSKPCFQQLHPKRAGRWFGRGAPDYMIELVEDFVKELQAIGKEF
jgi:hypothetical protein